MVECCKAVNIGPDGFIARVEDMRTVSVDIDAGDLLRIDIAADMIPTVYHEAFFSCLRLLLCKYCAI